MKIPVNIDSMVDIITNSSTEIFTYPNTDTQATIKKIVNEVLKTAGVKGKFEDYFKITRKLCEDGYQAFIDWIEEHKQIDIGSDDMLNPLDIRQFLKTHPDKEKELLDEFVSEGYEKSYRFQYNNDMLWELNVETLEGTDTGIAQMIAYAFTSEEVES